MILLNTLREERRKVRNRAHIRPTPYPILRLSELFGLECGHRICASCWDTYLTKKITSEDINQAISCAGHNCGVLVDDDTVMKLVRDLEVRKKYQNLILNSFVKV